MSEALAYDAFDHEPSAEPMPDLPLGEAFAVRALEFAARMKRERIKPIEYTDPRTRETSNYWIIHRRRNHYDDKTKLASTRHSGKVKYELRQVIVVHKEGNLDIATSEQVFLKEDQKQYAPHHIENVGKALHLEKLDSDQRHAAWESFVADLGKPAEHYGPRES